MQQGVSTDGVQLAICQGQPYGGRSHTAAEREVACQQYEQITGLTAPDANTGEGILFAGSIAVVVVLCAAVCFVISRRKFTKKAP